MPDFVREVVGNVCVAVPREDLVVKNVIENGEELHTSAPPKIADRAYLRVRNDHAPTVGSSRAHVNR